MSTFGIKVDDSALRGLFAGLRADVADAVRPAAQAGAQVLYDAVKANVAALGRKTGNLDRSIYQVHSADNSVEGKRAEYHVSWNHKKAPHGHLVEYGYLQRWVMYRRADGQIRPLIRPGLDGVKLPGGKGRRAKQRRAEFYVPLPGGPRLVPGKAFVRRAQDQMPQAEAAMRAKFLSELQARGVIK